MIGIFVTLALCGCQGSDSAAMIQALASDTADACLAVHNTFAPYSGDVTICRTNSNNGSSVSIDKSGTMTLTRDQQSKP